ncbi:unnamed protein product [Trichogramma brassicae]|uniref:Uncharacterized protein n=1 Tax=Trichogramma brassicae TaxID=86971 RepID=A0A6H5I5H1_9HYME|nr:unnamed protein product [Trichogramma brassicae]
MVPRHQKVLRRGDTRREECVSTRLGGTNPRRSTPFALTRLLAENNRQLLLGNMYDAIQRLNFEAMSGRQYCGTRPAIRLCQLYEQIYMI